MFRANNTTPITKDGDGGVIAGEFESYSGGTYVAYITDYRHISISKQDGSLINNGSDIETVTVEVVDGLEVARGTDPSNATVLRYNGDVTLSIDSQQTTKALTNGSVSFNLTTDKPAGSEIEIIAESLANHPAESDSATIEVVSE